MAYGQGQQAAPPAAQASTTITQTAEPTRTLRLRGGHETNGRSVQWADDVVDNEGLGRKSSKVCCIYHKPKAVGDSSDEWSSSDSSSDSESEPTLGKAPEGDGGERQQPACRHTRRQRDRQPGDKQKRPPSPNAYEKVPKPKDMGKTTAAKQ